MNQQYQDYCDTLRAQWNNLRGDFAQEYDRLLLHGLSSPHDFDGWLATRFHRWSSVAYPEGIILEQMNSREFSRALTGKMEAFRFEEVQAKPDKPVWQSVVLSLLAGVISSGVLLLLHWHHIRTLVSGVVVFVVVLLGFLRSAETERTAERKRVKEAYLAQISEYMSELTAVCEEFGSASDESAGEAVGTDSADETVEGDKDGEGGGNA